MRAVTSCTLWEFDTRPLQRLAKRDPDLQRVLCESYLHYLKGVEQRWAAKTAKLGHLPKRIPRIKAQVEHMLKKAKRKIEETKEEGGGTEGVHIETQSESEESDNTADLDMDRQASMELARISSRRVPIAPIYSRFRSSRLQRPSGQLHLGRTANFTTLERESDAAVLEDEQLIGSMEEGEAGEN